MGRNRKSAISLKSPRSRRPIAVIYRFVKKARKMTPAEFVTNWRVEKDDLLRQFMGDVGESVISQKISSLNLSERQTIMLREVMDLALTDAFYTLLLGLDGVASIGGDQRNYRVLDENGLLVCGDGQVEAEAYAQFHQAG